jgi:dynein heavy chain, axonemal
MGPPGGGRTFVTPRLLRHLSMISIAEFDDDTLNRIFGTILRFYFANNQFSSDLAKLEPKLVQSTTLIYHFAMSELLPTPTKSHYLFNLRDFAKVVMGFCMGDKDHIENVD